MAALLAAIAIPLAQPVGAQSPEGAKQTQDFKRFDATGNGYLSGTEITACACAQYDADGDGRITFLEFAKGRGVSRAGGASAPKPQPVPVAPAAAEESDRSGYKAGDAVEVKWTGGWYKSRVLSAEGSGYRIRYDGYSSAWDEVVGTDRIRRVGALPPASTLGKGKTALNGLYLRIARLQGGRQTHEHYRFWPDGRVCKQIPVGGAESATVESMQRQSPEDCGRYAVQGESITFDLPGYEKPYTVNFRQFDGTNFEMNFMPTVRVRAYPPGARLDGAYEGLHYPRPLRADSYVFRPNGTFAFQDRAVGAEDSGPPTSASGTYQLAGNTLVLTSANGTKRYTIYPLDEKGTLVLDLTTLSRK